MTNREIHEINTAEICACEESSAILKDAVYRTAQFQDATEMATSAMVPESGNIPNNSEGSLFGPHAVSNKILASMNGIGEDGVPMAGKVSGKGPGGTPVVGKALGMALGAAPQTTVKVDVETYQAWLDDPDLSDQQKEQIVEALWQIILCFVDLGFGISPLEDACGQLTEIEGACGAEPQDMLECGADTLTNEFNTVAAE